MKNYQRLLLVVVGLFAASDVGAQPGFTKQTISFQTADGFTIQATLGLPATTKERLPAVILIHQGGSDRTEWTPFFSKLQKENYVVLAYDVRGHGASDKVKSVYALFDDPKQAPLDLRAALQYLRSLSQVDSQRIGVVGASIGANLACVASSEMGVKTAVAMSGKTSAVFNLAGKKLLKLHSIFYIASAGDQGGKRAQWARELYEKTQKPHKIEIVKNSSAHGVSIFDDAPDLANQILAWLRNTL
ncbi:MAG: alpha/beta hydrolase [bacterium]